MSEYAIRKSDKASIKIGTCESMYYLRHEDIDKIIPEETGFKPKGLIFRLPFPDEDHILPGDYEQYDRGADLFNFHPFENEEITEPCLLSWFTFTRQ